MDSKIRFEYEIDESISHLNNSIQTMSQREAGINNVTQAIQSLVMLLRAAAQAQFHLSDEQRNVIGLVLDESIRTMEEAKCSLTLVYKMKEFRRIALELIQQK